MGLLRLIQEGQERGEIARKTENQANLVSDGNKVKKTLSDIGLTAKESHVYQRVNVPSRVFSGIIRPEHILHFTSSPSY